mgnify:CR=1 FL=1
MEIYCERSRADDGIIDVADLNHLRPLWIAHHPNHPFRDDAPRSMLRLHVPAPFALTGLREGFWSEVEDEAFHPAHGFELIPDDDHGAPSSSLIFRGTLRLTTQGRRLALRSWFGTRHPASEKGPDDVVSVRGSADSLEVVGCGQGNWKEVMAEDWCLVYDLGADTRYPRSSVEALVAGRAIPVWVPMKPVDAK